MMGPELEIAIPAWISNFTSKMRSQFISSGYQGTNHSRNLDLHDYGHPVPFMLELGPVNAIMFVKPFEVFR